MSDTQYATSGLVRLTRPQLIGTMTGLMLAALLAAIDQTIVGTAEPRIIASLAGFDRYPWVATIYLLCSTVAVPIFASLYDRSGRKPYFERVRIARAGEHRRVVRRRQRPAAGTPARTLPKTASTRPLFGLASVLVLTIGLALTIRRRVVV